MYYRLFILVILFVLNGCTSHPKNVITKKTFLPSPPIQSDAFENDVAVIESYQDVFTLTFEQQKHFFDFYHNPVNESLTELERLYAYLEARLDNFNYHSDTLIAKEVLEKNTGNCLSLAILTKSLADLLGIKIKYELVNTPSVFQKKENVLMVFKHIRTVLHSKSKLKGDFFSTKIMRVDYFPSAGTHSLRKVPETEFYAMFYNNKAVEALVENKINLAFAYLMESLKLLPTNAETISMMGILHGRLGLTAGAEQIFKYGLTYSDDEEILLKNYHSLLVRSNRVEEADKIAFKLKKYNKTNPYTWIALADRAYQNQDYSLAIIRYRKAAKIANYLHEPYAGIARAKHHLSKNKAASDSILKALANSHDKVTTRRYQSKYEFFQGKIDSD